MTYKTLREALFIYVNRRTGMENVEVDPLLETYINAVLKDYYVQTKRLKGKLTLQSTLGSLVDYSLVQVASGAVPKRVWFNINAISFDGDDITLNLMERRDKVRTPYHTDVIYWLQEDKTLWLKKYSDMDASKDIVIEGSYYPVFASDTEAVDFEDDYEAIVCGVKAQIEKDFGDMDRGIVLRTEFEDYKRKKVQGYRDTQLHQMYLYNL